MPTKHALYSAISPLILAVVLILGGCNYPEATPNATSTPDQNVIGTAAAKTLAVEMAKVTAGATQIPMMTSIPTAAPTVTTTSEQQGLSVTDTPPPPPPPPSPTPPPPPSTPMVTASASTNCRTGPSPAYPALGALLVGQSSPALGRNNDSSWWFIDNPGRPGTGCWVWGQTTQLQGEATSLKVIIPPPPPPPTPLPRRFPTPTRV